MKKVPQQKEEHTETEPGTLVVIGGGAAGFFCAVNAARMNPQLRVMILEKTNKLLSKVKVSGGGRCNTTHACFEIEELVQKYPRGKIFLKKAFHWFNTNDTINWFAQRGVQLVAEEDGRMFPVTNSSQTIIDCLLKEASRFRVEIQMQTEVTGIEAASKGWDIHTNKATVYADKVCIACGGFPKTAMFDWLRLLGHHIEAPVPSLFTFNMPGNPVTKLMGLSVEQATVKIAGTKLAEQGPLLITHWGMSGPVILKLSAWGARELANRQYHFTILVNWLGIQTEHELRNQWNFIRNEHASQKLVNRNPFSLPARLWQYLLQQSGIAEEMRWGDMPANLQNQLIRNLTAQEFAVKGKTTFKEEFVTCGGIQLSEVDPNTMQSRKQPGIYFAGEILDVDGVTGGFNFQNAWTTGWIAARAAAGIS